MNNQSPGFLNSGDIYEEELKTGIWKIISA